MNLTDAESEVMEILWLLGSQKASTVADLLETKKGWHRNTSYTLISRLIKKGAIEREEPNYVCIPKIREIDILNNKATSIVEQSFNGSASLFLSAYYHGKEISHEEAQQLKKLIDKLSDQK